MVYDPERYNNQRVRSNLVQKQRNDFVRQAMEQTPINVCNTPQSQRSGAAPEGSQFVSVPAQKGPAALKWEAVPTEGWKLENKVYPFEKVGYQDQNPGPPPTENKLYAENVETARQECKPCEQAKGDLLPLGCSIAIADGEDLSVHGRQNVNSWRTFPGYTSLPQGQNPVFIAEPNRSQKRGDNFNLTPLFSQYNEEMFRTPLDRTENMISTGVMVNPWTGKTYETFEKQLPPPQTSKYAIEPDQLKRTNPQLVWLNGGIDPNAPLPSKKEVMLDLPGPDGGPNVWGDGLYAEKIGRRMHEYVASQVFNNRNGIYSTEPSFAKEAPAGYVGLVEAVRPVPYLPPTQRSFIDIKGHTGPVNQINGVQAIGDPVSQHGIVETRKYDFTSCGRTGMINGFGGQDAATVIPVMQPKPTWRGRTDGTITGPVDARTGLAGPVLIDPTVRDTLKGLNETQFPITNGAPQESMPTTFGGVFDPTVRDTLKGLNETQFPITNGSAQESIPTTITGVIDPTVRDTLKGLNELQFPGANPSGNDIGDYTPFSGDLRAGNRRHFYSTDTRVGGMQYTPDLSGYPTGPAITTSRQNRGQEEFYWVEPSQIPNDLGTTMSRNIGLSTRDIRKREMSPNVMPADFTQETSVYLGSQRHIPVIFPNCQRPDDIDDEWRNIRPTWFREGVSF